MVGIEGTRESSNYVDNSDHGIRLLLDHLLSVLPQGFITYPRMNDVLPDQILSPDMVQTNLSHDNNWGAPVYHTDPFSQARTVLNPRESQARDQYLQNNPMPVHQKPHTYRMVNGKYIDQDGNEMGK